MSNQTLFWASLIFSWLSTLFLKKEDLRRYMPVSLFCMLTFAFIFETGITLHWWAVKETFFPLINLPIFLYGAYPIGTIWIFKYTYGHFWLFLITNIILDYILIFFLIDWFVQRGVWEAYITYSQVLFITTSLAILIYGYQMWQEGQQETGVMLNGRSAICKPLSKENPDEPNNQ
ncbi:hypothetical protein SAMN04515679_2550 [Pelosinus fermentans]|uniref:Uncharacterized protein n=2 Tax=Pelosinus TaxID=365348 RepID=I9LDS8_9FIRM|nr:MULTISPECIES: hypothetical protein [Pelosinus]EIW18501.1 hypothetical protein FB4_3321 [Pelosinus fermentans B4]EIW24515.1 hypothetical protein FA11_3322 [Pelosinus fermentans A11]OAM94427.1 hypothetical protein FR7_02445 [Pelosinus fermentans DSM 17108]SDR08824.1 hypothetical protein SAMN04515679_2550 [Pelosinus fermentans]